MLLDIIIVGAAVIHIKASTAGPEYNPTCTSVLGCWNWIKKYTAYAVESEITYH